MTVVLRCPSCGTTRSTPGECEACHDAQVRYFCTNHKPGQWLTDGTCPHCGARFGEVVRRAPAAPAADRARPPARARAPRAPISRPSSAPPVALEPAEFEWRARERSPRADVELAPGTPGMPLWLRVVRDAAARSRDRSGRTEAERESPAIARSLGGCLVRVMLVALFLFVALVIGLFWFGHSMLGL